MLGVFNSELIIAATSSDCGCDFNWHQRRLHNQGFGSFYQSEEGIAVIVAGFIFIAGTYKYACIYRKKHNVQRLMSERIFTADSPGFQSEAIFELSSSSFSQFAPEPVARAFVIVASIGPSNPTGRPRQVTT
jgi:hypothetical protein